MLSKIVSIGKREREKELQIEGQYPLLLHFIPPQKTFYAEVGYVAEACKKATREVLNQTLDLDWIAHYYTLECCSACYMVWCNDN